MKRFNVLQTLIVLFVFSLTIWGLVPSIAEGSVPQLINFQGVLKDGSGNPVANGSYSVIFTVYDAPAGGTALWAETTSVSTTDGLFTVLLGSLNPVPDSLFNDPSRHLGIKVDADPEMAPRQQLSSVGYSYVSSQWASAGQNLFRLNGNVGIGTASPGSLLEVFSSDGGTGVKLADFRSGLSASGNTNYIKLGSTSTVDGGTFGYQFHGASSLAGTFIGDFNGNPQLFVSGGGNVGIGTTSPAAGTELHVKASGANTANYRLESGQGTVFDVNVLDLSNVQMGATSNVPLHLVTNATPRMTLTADGNVGIGTTSPTKLLDIAGNFAEIRFRDLDNAVEGQLSAFGAGLVDLRSTTNHPLTFTTNNTERMRITGTGNVGIGTTSPTKRLEVTGSAKVSDTLFASNVSSNSPLSLQAPAGTTRMFISDATGNVGVGTTNPSEQLEVNGWIRSSSGIKFGALSVLSLSSGDILLNNVSTNSIRFTLSGFEKMRIASSGNVGIGTASPQSALQVSGYMQMDVTTGAPPAADCDAASEHGRMKFDAAAGTLYICGSSGWVTK